jgi:hypothetical protein
MRKPDSTMPVEHKPVSLMASDKWAFELDPGRNHVQTANKGQENPKLMSSTHLRHFVTSLISLRNEKVRDFDGKV